MKVIAIADGFHGKGKKAVLIKQGTVFEFTGKKLGKWMKEYGPGKPTEVAEDSAGPTAKEIRAQLDAAGVPYPARASKPELLEILKSVV